MLLSITCLFNSFILFQYGWRDCDKTLRAYNFLSLHQYDTVESWIYCSEISSRSFPLLIVQYYPVAKKPIISCFCYCSHVVCWLVCSIVSVIVHDNNNTGRNIIVLLLSPFGKLCSIHFFLDSFFCGKILSFWFKKESLHSKPLAVPAWQTINLLFVIQ